MADAQLSSSLPDDMLPIDTAYVATQETDGKTNDVDTCRICRSEGTVEEPLFHPCKCSGSIKHVHQDCLMEWLSHTNKKHCELCKTAFRFTKLYDADMPDALPVTVFFTQAAVHVIKYCLTWLRAFLVALIWLVILPWSIRWSWRVVFYIMDAGWARDSWLEKLTVAENNSTLASAGVQDLLLVLDTTNSSGARASEHRRILPDLATAPFALQFLHILWAVLTHPSKLLHQTKTLSQSQLLNRTSAAAASTLLSGLDFANTMTIYPSLNRAIIDVLEGQIITVVVVVAFILVFLIREWVIQQQPILNAAAHVRDAEQELERVEEARQRLRDEIRQVEEQLDQLNNTHAALNHDRHSRTQSRSSVELAGRSRSLPVPATRSRNASNAFSHIDWSEFKHRVSEASESWISADRAISPDSVSMIRDLTDEVLQILGQAEEDRLTDVDAFGQLIEWVRRIPPEIDSVWLSDLATVFAQLKPDQQASSGLRTSISDERVRETSSLDTTFDSPTSTALDESDAQSLFHIREDLQLPQGMNKGTSSDGHAKSARQDSSDSLGSWQAIPSHEVRGGNPTTALNSAFASELSSFADEARASSLSEDDRRSSSFSDPLERDDHSDSGSGIMVNDTGSTPALARVEPRDRHAVDNRNILDRICDLFWADIDTTGLPDEAFQVEGGENNADGLQGIRVRDDDVGIAVADAAVQQEAQIQDPEVLAAAAEAGLDAEAIEEAEDLEGIMELIGMQGPIIVLFQTAFICAGLITLTLWGAIGTPYLFGKLALQIFRDPMLFFIIMPLQAITYAGDFLLDLATLLTGSLINFCLSTMTQILFLFRLRSIFEPAPTYADNLADASKSAVERAATHLITLFSVDASAAGTDSYFLLGSLQAHNALLSLKAGIGGVVESTLSRIGWLAALPPSHYVQLPFIWALEVTKYIYHDLLYDYIVLRNLVSHILSGNAFYMPLREPHELSLDPLLSFWSGRDRAITVCIGYIFLVSVGAAFLLRTEPIFSSPAIQRVEKALADILKQAGGVLKVILIISIEMLLFPLYCGILLDFALLPLFEGVTFESRLNYAATRPYMFVFLHWFLGTAYMFNFALFVSMCRSILRSGVLYFIRDPDDPTFHPVRDVLERSIAAQLRKIAFSGLVYGLMVILCMGGVVWGISHSFLGIFPLRWTTPDPALEFPIEFIVYNFLSPFLFKLLKPGIGMEALYKRWLRKCARTLRLSHFLFGDRHVDEESEGTSGSFSASGSYVRVPASDQVRIQRGQPVFAPVTEEDVANDEAQQKYSEHGRPGQRFRNVYIPPWFRARIGLFLAGLWSLSAAIGIGVTVLPLVLGRALCSAALPQDVSVNDIWAYALGLHTLLLFSFALFRLPKLSSHLSSGIKNAAHSALGTKVRHGISCAVRIVYVYGFVLVIMPTLAFLLLHLYVIVPIRTYAESTSSMGILASSNGSGRGSANGTGKPNLHIIYALPDWTLGFVVSRLITVLLRYTRYPLPAAIMRRITRNGRLDPDAWVATRAVVLPTLLACNVALFAPAAFATVMSRVLLPLVLPAGSKVSKMARTKIYRYSYPILLCHFLALWGALTLNKAMGRWKNLIKDEVYLVGERLHNFGERKPPQGSKGIMKKGKEPVGAQQSEEN
ncbi:hypothetical protein ANO11243_007250 [Dothideomycetidae sp. 11243]|nr:hypothetical protein ANO11243_007250 [fungal sp. No.11243]